MNTQKIKGLAGPAAWVIFLVFCLGVVAATQDVLTINTNDYRRAVYMVLEEGSAIIQPWVPDVQLASRLRDDFVDLSRMDYLSSATFLLYLFAGAWGVFTDTLDLQLIGSFSKIANIALLLVLFRKVVGLDRITPVHMVLFCLFASFVMFSTNIAFYNSYYQETYCLIFLVLALFYLLDGRNRFLVFLLFAVSVTYIACAKSQFFYVPLMALPFVIYKSGLDAKRIAIILAAQALAVACVVYSTGTTNYNKYHALYFGAYLAAERAGAQLDASVDTACVGIDAWGNRYDLQKGAVSTDIGEKCFHKHQDIGLGVVVSEHISYLPSLLGHVFTEDFKRQFVYDYFHVFRDFKVVLYGEPNSLMHGFNQAKDRLFYDVKLYLPLIMMLLCALVGATRVQSTNLFLAGMFYSQIYISFIGEGYRDLSKHLFLANASLDLMAFILLGCLLRFFSEKMQARIARQGPGSGAAA